jgi:hypothetical protein
MVALFACQPVPRPFEAHRKAPNTLLQQADFRGIRVLPLADAPPETAEKLAAEMANALLDQNVPAFVRGGNRSSLTLVSEVIDRSQNAIIVWTLVEFDGTEVGRHNQPIVGASADQWVAGEPKLIADLAAQAAIPIASMVRGDEAREFKAPPVFVGMVSGTTVPEAIRIQVALRQALRKLGTRIADTPSNKTLVATADVTITRLDDELSEVAIVWAVQDPFGTKIGKINQASAIAHTVIENNWGQLSRQAGIAAAAGIVELVSQIDWSRGFLPPTAKRRK